jgi:hypothetical protein
VRAFAGFDQASLDQSRVEPATRHRTSPAPAEGGTARVPAWNGS